MRPKNFNKCLPLILIIILILCSSFIYSVSSPEGPTSISIVNSTKRAPQSSQSINAIAGNVTQLNIFAQSTTNTWQGYYGNVTGTISLGDSSGRIMYDWSPVNPSGQIYASASEIDFADGNIECYNFSRTGGSYTNLSTYETSLGLSENSADGINETFNETTTYDSFYLSTTLINETCPVAYLYNSSNSSSPSTYQELLLYDLTANDIIYTSIIKPGGIVGFDNNIWDFQMIVGENGHAADQETTTYYFYVALE